MTEGRFDWKAAHARLERLQRVLASDAKADPEAERRILDDRARKTARPLPGEQADRAQMVPSLAFSRAGNRYAVDARYVLEALPRIPPTVLPVGSPALAGVVLYRSEIIAVVDLSALVDPRRSHPT